jgi:DNA-binding response OmpR family regulator
VSAVAPPAREFDGAARALVVLGDRALANTVDFTLRHGGYVRRCEATMSSARTAIAEWKPHLLLLDIDLEAGAGIQLIDEARAGGPMGVIALTRRSDLRGKLDAFERGADDYIGIPFVPDDLVARARQRSVGPTATPGRSSYACVSATWSSMCSTRKVIAAEREVHQSSLDQALLYLLAANAGTVLTREQILDALWGTDFVSESKVVDWHVRALRAKLQDDWHKPRYIETVPGTGYRFVPASGAVAN